MKNLKTFVNESLKSDISDGNKILKKLTKFKGDLDKVAKKDVEKLFFKQINQLNELIDSSIESLNFSITGAKAQVNENNNIKTNLKSIYSTAKQLLREMNSLDDKNTTLSSDLLDSIVDFGDAVELLKDISR